MNRILFATNNQGKLTEVRSILKNDQILSLRDAGIDINVVEDGTTYCENAIKKAVEIMKLSGEITLSDDSGIEIDYLDQQPGVYSARFLGENTPYTQKNKLIIELLKGVLKPYRTARYVAVIAAAFPDGRIFTARGTMEGFIATKPRGEKGFGYDPIFYIPQAHKTVAEMDMDEKNGISHRGKALTQMKEILCKSGDIV